jgi:hypothetical protein
MLGVLLSECLSVDELVWGSTPELRTPVFAHDARLEVFVDHLKCLHFCSISELKAGSIIFNYLL